MSDTIRVYLHEDALTQLLEQFDDKEKDLRKLVFDRIKTFTTDAKMIKLNKTFTARTIKNNLPFEDTFTLKEYPFDKHDALPSKPKWHPEKMDKDETKFYEINVTEKTMDYIKLFSQVYQNRILIFNKSIPKSDPNRNDILIDQAQCLEQLIHEQLYGTIMDKIRSAIEDEFDEEFEEANKSEEDEKPPKAKQREKKEE